jgi:hypothetical protein
MSSIDVRMETSALLSQRANRLGSWAEKIGAQRCRQEVY